MSERSRERVNEGPRGDTGGGREDRSKKAKGAREVEEERASDADDEDNDVGRATMKIEK